MTKIENRINTPKEVQEYFESIKGNHVALRQFFTAMPKGGDVHNHLTGSAYAETYFELAASKGMFVNPETGRLYAKKPMDIETIRLSKDMDDLHNHRMALIDKWSIRNFQPYKYPLGPDEYFFGTFGLLSALTGGCGKPCLSDARVESACSEGECAISGSDGYFPQRSERLFSER